ncbi:DEDD exonuclease domain-containing protein [Tenggerimyces flavus]|uniref:DEDD exonuclease domain-containing protein n=1 Tax=Tenggerimyces flavus TaxID=1708749 RepID=A0ABV7YMK9_9ACTN|nr:DEDD exonuclease domain-containing protein [Tenggerimyces flavus]MBM7788712.1 DNA polymerase-3 subunit epsilon [Tenggerimyces flavus]
MTAHALPAPSAPSAPGAGYVQAAFDELGTPLRDVTFCVVDLETTGGSHASESITEVGAVKVRAGEWLGEFQTLVNPGTVIPPFIAVLTGITDGMVASAPNIKAVLPAFLEFAEGCVIVAHNAPFDVGFLRTAALQHGYHWPSFHVVDTALLARRVLTRDDAPNCKLSTLATVFHTRVKPVHRALADAQATVDVLHGLLERLGPLGVQTLEELATFTSRVSPQQRRKRHLAEKLPHAPGVYIFSDDRGRTLYVGKSKDLRTRVRTYFTASETRSRMGEMVGLATQVKAIECTTPLEAEVRELRLIAATKPRYNRRSRFPERVTWVKLTVEPFPRVSLVKEVRRDDATYLGPFGSRKVAEKAVAALHEAFPIRQCTQKLGRIPKQGANACVLYELGRCDAPCVGAIDTEAYAEHVAQAKAAIENDPQPVVDAMVKRIRSYAALERYEEASRHRDRMAAFVRATARTQRIAALARCPQILAAKRSDEGGWELHLVRYGRLAGAAVSPAGAHPQPTIDLLLTDAEVVEPPPPPTPAATAEETERILAWLEQPGIRLVEVEGEWTCPTSGAQGQSSWLDSTLKAQEGAVSSEDRRGLRPIHQPVRAQPQP